MRESIERAVLDQMSGDVALVADVALARSNQGVEGTVADNVPWNMALVADIACWSSIGQGAELDEVARNAALLTHVARGRTANLVHGTILHKMAWNAASLANV